MQEESGYGAMTAAHLPGKLSVMADRESRSIHDNMEWQQHPDLFAKLCEKWGKPEIDLFASRLNNQLETYIWHGSQTLGSGVIAIYHMNENWSNLSVYAFPPFNIFGMVLQKIELQNAMGLIVVPY